MTLPLLLLLLLLLPPPPHHALAATDPPLQTAEAGLSLLWPTPIHASRTPASLAAAAAMRRALPRLAMVDPGVRKSNKDSNGWHSSELLGEGALETHRRLEPAAAAAASMHATALVEGAVRAAAQTMVAAMGAARFGLLLGLPGGPEELDDVAIHVQNIWANVNNQSDHNIMHTHPSAVLSGALYVDADAEAGLLEFADPRPLVQCPRTDNPQDRESLFMVCAWCPEHLCARGTGLTPRRLLDAATLKNVPPAPGLMLLWPSWLPHRVAPQPLNRSRVSISFNVWVERRRQREGGEGSPTTPSLDPVMVAEQRRASEAFLSVARGREVVAAAKGILEADSNHSGNAPVGQGSYSTSLTMHWPTWLQEATLADAAPSMKALKPELKAWADARVASRLAAAGQEEEKGDEAEDLFSTSLDDTGADKRQEHDGRGSLAGLKDWVSGVAANVSERLSSSSVGNAARPLASTCPQVTRVRALLVRQQPYRPGRDDATGGNPAAVSRQRLPFPTPTWAQNGRPQIAGLFVVNARCKTSNAAAAAQPQFVVDVHDPRPEAGVDLAPMDSGRTLRWLPSRGGRGGDLLLYPAWLHHALSLPPNTCESSRTFISVFIELGDNGANLEGDSGFDYNALDHDLSELIFSP